MKVPQTIFNGVKSWYHALFYNKNGKTRKIWYCLIHKSFFPGYFYKPLVNEETVLGNINSLLKYGSLSFYKDIHTKCFNGHHTTWCIGNSCVRCGIKK